jgi:hypothetical protein
LDRTEYGPDFRFIARLIAERGLNPVIACETPNLDLDAQKLRDMVTEEMKKTGK